MLLCFPSCAAWLSRLPALLAPPSSHVTRASPSLQFPAMRNKPRRPFQSIRQVYSCRPLVPPATWSSSSGKVQGTQRPFWHEEMPVVGRSFHRSVCGDIAFPIYAGDGGRVGFTLFDFVQACGFRPAQSLWILTRLPRRARLSLRCGNASHQFLNPCLREPLGDKLFPFSAVGTGRKLRTHDGEAPATVHDGDQILPGPPRLVALGDGEVMSRHATVS
eukprot:scaffold7362_cov266-Pinguiococcus_pyrenoidosus.AAC.15